MQPDEQPNTAEATPTPIPEVDSTLRMLAELEHRVESLRNTAVGVDQRERAVAAREAAAAESLAAAENRVREITEQSERLAQARVELEARENALRESESRVEAVDVARAEAEARAAELAQITEQINTERAELQAREARLREAESRSTESDSRAAELAAESQRIAGAAAQLAEREERVRVAESRANEAAERLARLDRAENELAEREARNAETEHRIETAEARLADAEARLAADAERIEEAERRLAEAELLPAAPDPELTARLETATERVAHLESKLEEYRADADSNQHEVERAVRMLAEANCSLATMRAEKAALEEETRVLRAMPLGGRSDAFNRVRRSRLASIRRRLRTDAKKLEQISRVLAERQSKVAASEKMVSLQKSTLLEAEEAREAAEKARGESAAMLSAARRVQEKYERRGAAATAATFLAASVVALAAVAAGSWVAVSKFVQPTCRASSSITMSPGVDQLGGAAAETWEEYVAALPEDPRFVEYAASRYKARGVKELSTPTAVTAMLNDSFELESIGPGRLVADLEGPGAGRTAQTLSTLATSIATYANETRGLRSDGASTASDTAPASQAEILDDPRPQMFAMVAGAGAALLMILMMVLWRSVRGAVIKAVRETADILPMTDPAEAELVPAMATAASNEPPKPIRTKRDGIQRRGSFKS